ncbi:MAG: hypothetical protein V4599_07155 [Verrucomicrobiota bacterium]
MSWNHRALKWVLFLMSFFCYAMAVDVLASIMIKYEIYEVDLGLAARHLGVAGSNYFGSIEAFAFILTLLPWMLLQTITLAGLAWKFFVTVEWSFVCFGMSLLSAAMVCSWMATSGRDEPLASWGKDPGNWMLGAVSFFVLVEALSGFNGLQKKEINTGSKR